MPNPRRWFEMKADKKTGEIRIFGEIGFFSISAEDFLEELDNLGEVDTIRLHINSPGGEVFDGFTIYNVLKRHPAKVSVLIDGVAASIASVIAMAGDTVIMPENAFIMMHNPMMFAGGDAKDFRNAADVLEKIKTNAVKAYSKKATELSKDELAEMMDDETWLSAEEAVEKGFADEIEGILDEPNEGGKLESHNFKRIPQAAMCFFQSEKNANNEGAGSKPKSSTKRKEEPSESGNSEINNNENSPQKGDGKMPLNAKEIAMKISQNQARAMKAIAIKLEMAKLKLSDDEYQKLAQDLPAHEYIGAELNAAIGDEVETIEARAGEIIADAEKKIFETVMKSPTVVPPEKNVAVGKTSHEKIMNAARVSFMKQTKLPLNTDEQKEYEDAEKNGYGVMTIHGFFREILTANNVHGAASLVPVKLYDATCDLRAANPRMAGAQGSGDFTNVFADVANKALQDAWTSVPVTYQPWTGKDSIPDFRAKNIVRISDMSDIVQILENEGFPFGAMADSKETATLITVGLAYSLSRKAIINDDINALTDIPTKLGRSVQRYINRRVYTILFGTAMAGPTMNEDSKAMFHADHSNFVASGSGGAPTNATLSVLRRYLIKQTQPQPDGGQSNSIYTRAEPKFVLAHTDLDHTIEALIYPAHVMTTTADTPYTRQFIRKLIPIHDPVLDELMDANSSQKGYYLITDPQDAGCINVYNLTGSESPTMRRKVSDVAEPLGTMWDIYYDCQVAAVDYRGAAANYGA